MLFRFLKKRKKYVEFHRIIFQRDSVCMGDDSAAPHNKTLNVCDWADMMQQLEQNYLPGVVDDVTWYAHRAISGNDILFKVDCPRGGHIKIYDVAIDKVSDLPSYIFMEYKCNLQKQLQAAKQFANLEIRQASKAYSDEIARLIMMAMTDECCLHFCGEGFGLDDFYIMMVSLVEREDTQYSYKNTLMAVADNKLVGIAVSYDGAQLHELRRAFIHEAKKRIGKDHSGMDDETQAGELYLDSLAVLPEYRRQGIAQRLLKAIKEKADKMGLPCVGLLVDNGNPAGEALYVSVGFCYANDSYWGGHPMKHMVL